MALPSARQKSQVDPDKGIYVEMEGVMEVRYLSDDIDYQKPSEDMFDFQQRVQHIPDDFCHKNKHTTEQNVFFCLVCNCDLKNLRPLKDHVTGNKHIRKACDYKREVMGIRKEPQNAPRKKEAKTERPRVDVSERLEDRLKVSGSPAIGLEYISEFINPNNYRDHPMYTCSLAGCKSAWGTSDDMIHHVQNSKHQKNFFRLKFPEDSRIAGLTKDEILRKASEYEEDMGGPEERDYGEIIVIEDLDKYMELRNRPDSWSEKKAQLGLVGARANSNYELLGKRRAPDRRSSDLQPRSQSQSQFEESDWEPPTKKSVVRDLVETFTRGIADVRDSVETFKGRKGDQEHENILFYLKTYEDLLSLHQNDEAVAETDRDFPSRAVGWSSQLRDLRNVLEEKTEMEDRAMKEIMKLMDELEEEISNYYSGKTTRKYQNIQARMKQVTTKMSAFKPSSSHNQKVRDDVNKRLATLWTEFEDRSDSVVEMLTKTKEGGAGLERKVDMREEAIRKYEQEMIEVVKVHLSTHHLNKFTDIRALDLFAVNTVKNKIVPQEIKRHEKILENPKRERSWADFHVSETSKQFVREYLEKKMKAVLKK